MRAEWGWWAWQEVLTALQLKITQYVCMMCLRKNKIGPNIENCDTLDVIQAMMQLLSPVKFLPERKKENHWKAVSNTPTHCWTQFKEKLCLWEYYFQLRQKLPLNLRITGHYACSYWRWCRRQMQVHLSIWTYTGDRI